MCSGVAAAADVRGDYVEARTADVFTGPCFSNAEVFVSGNQAVMAWKVTEGSYQGVDLTGLSVAAAVRGTTTFSADTPDQACSVLIVDAKADARQRDVLIAMAKALGGDRLSHVVDVKTATIALKIEPHTLVVADTAAQPNTGCPRPPGPPSGQRGWPRS